MADYSLAILSEFMEGQRGILDMDYVTDSGHLALRLQYWTIDPPIILSVSGESPASACFRFQYFFRNQKTVHTLTMVMLDH